LPLGPSFSLVPPVIWSVLMVRRTRIADRFLRPNLPGCREYAERVFFRLLPGFW